MDMPEEFKLVLHQSQWDVFVAVNGEEWTKRNCILARKVPVFNAPPARYVPDKRSYRPR